LVKASEASLEGSAGGDTVADTRSDDDARAGKHLTETGSRVEGKLA
jgi:hypothetical protein